MVPNIEPLQEEPATVNNENIVPAAVDDKMPNKFFNFLEDEEVNMNFEDNNLPETDNNTSVAPEKAMDTFSFKPEFETPEVVNNQALDENQLDSPVSDNLEVQNDLQPVANDVVIPTDSIFMPDLNSGNETPEDLIYQETPVQNDIQELNNEPVFNDNLQVNNNPVDNQVSFDQPIYEQPIENNPVIEDNSYIDNQQTIEPVMEPEINEPQVAPVQNQFFNVDIPSSNNEVTESVTPVIEEPVVQENTTVNNVEPIPAMSGDNVVDPVSYFDTLDPQFIDKIKESEGLDLKTAINEYRSVTAILNSRGFNISIDEADEPEKYHIVIDIDKQ